MIFTITALAIIYFSITILLLIENYKTLPIPFKYPIILFITGFAMLICIIGFITLSYFVKDLKKQIKNPDKYELIKEPIYKKTN